MPLIIENGSNVSNADAYADLADFNGWVLSVYGAANEQSDALKEAAIRRAVIYLDGLNWKGKRTNGRLQTRSWPRKDVYDSESNVIQSNEIPSELIFAQHRLALAELTNSGVLDAVFNSQSTIKREKIDAIEVEYAVPAKSADDAAAVVKMAMDAIQGLLTGSDATSSGGTKWISRA